MKLFNFKKNKKICEPETDRNPIYEKEGLVRSDSDLIASKEEETLFTKMIGDDYISKRQLDLTDEELEKMSITDGAEMWRLFSWYKKNVVLDDSKEKTEESHIKIERVAVNLIKKVMKAEELLYVYNVETGEPHLFSQTIKQNSGYLCTPPDIRIFTKSYELLAKSRYTSELLEIRSIENGEDGRGIEKFLNDCFYLNGAQGIGINNEETAINADMIISPPDFSGTKDINIPITNPNVLRWMLLMAQIPKIETDDEKLIYGLYSRFMSKEILKARFLVPMQKDADFPKAEEFGKITIEKATTIGFAQMKGKYDRAAIIMYTDWKKLREKYDGCDGMIMTIEEIISSFDVAINVTSHTKLGFYIGKEMYEDIKMKAES